jgi:two-component system, OmpR family, response regulator
MTHALDRIFVIDDDADIQEVVAVALEDFGGYTVAGCTSGAAALEQIPRFAADLILLDIAMPDMDGVMTLHALRGLPSLIRVPIIFFTAKATDLVMLMQLPGVVGVITKPFHHRDLVSQIGILWEGYARGMPTGPDLRRIDALRKRYLQDLPQRNAAIAALWATQTPGALAEIRQQVHQLAGSGASLGCAELSAAATLLQAEIDRVLTQECVLGNRLPPAARERIDTSLRLFDQAVARCHIEPVQWLSSRQESQETGDQ